MYYIKKEMAEIYGLNQRCIPMTTEEIKVLVNNLNGRCHMYRRLSELNTNPRTEEDFFEKMADLLNIIAEWIDEYLYYVEEMSYGDLFYKVDSLTYYKKDIAKSPMLYRVRNAVLNVLKDSNIIEEETTVWKPLGTN